MSYDVPYTGSVTLAGHTVSFSTCPSCGAPVVGGNSTCGHEPKPAGEDNVPSTTVPVQGIVGPNPGDVLPTLLRPMDWDRPRTQGGTVLPYAELPAVSPENVNHPNHYGGDTLYEAIKVIRAWALGFNLGNAVKYICRWNKKGDPIENLEKAVFYLQDEIKHLRRLRDASAIDCTKGK